MVTAFHRLPPSDGHPRSYAALGYPYGCWPPDSPAPDGAMLGAVVGCGLTLSKLRGGRLGGPWAAGGNPAGWTGAVGGGRVEDGGPE